MASDALEGWRTNRAVDLDLLFDAHRALRGTGVGRRTATPELNRAVVLRLASHFQGFSRELHAETAIAFGDLSHPTDTALAGIVSSGMQTARQLARVNAQPDSLATDFGRFGLALWDEMQGVDTRTNARRWHLRYLNDARNGLAHDDQRKVQKVLSAGYRIDLAWLRRWRSVLNGLARTMDIVTAEHLARLFRAGRPW